MIISGEVKLTSAGGALAHNQSSPSGTTVLGYNGYFYATRVYNTVYNDFADFQALAPGQPILYGKCYYATPEGLALCSAKCQLGVVGIASNTYGQAVGENKEVFQAPIAVAGWVLAFVDEEYAPGTPLMNDGEGNLTEMPMDLKRDYPERIVAIYIAPEASELWGPEGQKVAVDGRHWVKVR
jgi:hypothetical protein